MTDRPLRIAMFAVTFPVVSETFVLHQIAGLLELGHEVRLFADAPGDPGAPTQAEVERHHLLDRTTYMDLPPEMVPWEMPVWPLTGRTWLPGATTSILNARRIARELPKLARCLVRAPRLTRRALSPRESGFRAASLSSLGRLARLLDDPGGYDLLHAHFGPAGESFRFARSLWNAPLVVSFYGYDFTVEPRRQGPHVYRRLFEEADAVISLSDFALSRLEALGCPRPKLFKLPLGVDLSVFAPKRAPRAPKEPARVLTVGRLVEKKGHEFALRGVARARQQHPELRYEIIGDGPLRVRLEALAQELGLTDGLTWHGARDAAFVRERMAACDIFLLASVTAANGDQEGQGLVLQEAQAAGLPVVATDHGPFREGLVPDQTGFLVPERDPEAIAARVDWLVSHPDEACRMGQAGRRLVETEFDRRALDRRLAELYWNVLSAFRQPGTSPPKPGDQA